jgi:hypothetical protein
LNAAGSWNGLLTGRVNAPDGRADRVGVWRLVDDEAAIGRAVADDRVRIKLHFEKGLPEQALQVVTVPPNQKWDRWPIPGTPRRSAVRIST